MQVATRIVQRWRTPNKVAELIRQDVPFAILVSLSLLNEIDRIGKTDIDHKAKIFL
jgi:hypothetical protein